MAKISTVTGGNVSLFKTMAGFPNMYNFKGVWDYLGNKVITPDVLAVQVGSIGIYIEENVELDVTDTTNWGATNVSLAQIPANRQNKTFYVVAIDRTFEADKYFMFSDTPEAPEITRPTRVIAIIKFDEAGLPTKTEGYNSALETLGITGIASIEVVSV